MKRYTLIYIIAFILFGSNTASAQMSMEDQESAATNIRKLANAYWIILSQYVDSVSSEKITENAITSMLDNLDPHSSYLNKEEVKSSNETLQGNFEGIGISYNMIEDTLTVIETISGGPCEKLGVLPGDKIIYVNDSTIAGVKMPTTNIMKRLRGPKGTRVNIKILRQGKWIPFSIVRDKIPIYSIDAAYMISPNIGYIKINRFAATTYTEMLKAIMKLKSDGMSKLIIDLQSNGGGYMQSAVNIVDEFLPDNKTIVYTEGENTPKEVLRTQNSNGIFEDGKMVILINEYSASASEILSGAIQDWDRALIVGRRSFGKGLVQRPFTLNDGSEIRLTIARYHTPSGRCIQRPYTGGKEAYEKDMKKRYEHGEFVSADSINLPDSLKYSTLLLKRTVYGGGGIMPDVFVAADTTTMSQLDKEIFNNGIPNTVSLSYTDKHRRELELYNNVKTFEKKFDTTNLLKDVESELANKKIAYTAKEWEDSKELVSLRTKALVARNIWGIEAYYQIVNEEDNIVKKAIEILSDENKYEQLLQTNKK